MSIERLQDLLGYRFEDVGILHAALIHSSFAAENDEEGDNERLEFLGDAVLQLAVTAFLFEGYRDMREGQMAKVRAACVNRTELARLARSIDLGPCIRVGVGEHSSGGRHKDSILADAMEAVLAAVYLDAGYRRAEEVILSLWGDLIHEKAKRPGGRDYKTRLQELLAARGARPDYQVVGEGPDHAMEFTAIVTVDGEQMGEGTGGSKKEAQQEAARVAIDRLS